MATKIRVRVNGREIDPSTPINSVCPYCVEKYRTPIRQSCVVCDVCEEEFDPIAEGGAKIPFIR